MDWGDDRLPERFWQNGEISDKHWLWTGKLWSNGYGRFKIGGVDYRVHRLIYTIAVRPPQLNVLHHCDIRTCFQPLCLYEGTQQDNVDDRERRDRGARGSRSGTAKLTEDDVREIRRLYCETQLTQVQIGERFGIGQSNASHIILKRSWRHVD